MIWDEPILSFAEVDLASGWDEYPDDCKEQMGIKMMGFYRVEFAQSKIDWAKFVKIPISTPRDKYGRRIIDPEQENHQ